MTRRADVERAQHVAAGRVLVVHLERVERRGQALDDVVVDLQGSTAPHPLLLRPGRVLLALLLGAAPGR